MGTELKPCPFCGSKLVNYTRGMIGAPIVFMKCGNPCCGAIVSFDNEECHILPEKAIDHWDTRADLRPCGEWILHIDEETNAWECSLCHEVFQLMDGTPEENHMNYCHNCGARMSMEITEE